MSFDVLPAYGAFAILAAALFWRLPVRVAILVVFFGGWLVLPVGAYPPVAADVIFPWWIMGTGLPGDMLVTKAWVVPLVCLVWATVFDGSAWRGLRPGWCDALMALWCLWPLAGGLWVGQASPAPLTGTLYVTASWGGCWLLGRVWFSTAESQLLFVKACAWSGVACLPVALLEGVWGGSAYQLLYDTHPFRLEGRARYVAFRPVGMFEHGNQYGIWVALAAFAALWLSLARPRQESGLLYVALALVCTVIAFAAQSVGSLLLLLAGLVGVAVWRWRGTFTVLVAGGCCVAALLALHLSGVVPVRWIAEETGIGRAILQGFKSLGRGSFPGRIAMDLRVMGLVRDTLVAGTMTWDWWRPAEVRPWGLWLLLIGQFGVVGCLMAYGSLVAPALRAVYRLRGFWGWGRENVALILGFIVVLALADSLLNDFLYFPAWLAAGAVASAQTSVQRRAK